VFVFFCGGYNGTADSPYPFPMQHVVTETDGVCYVSVTDIQFISSVCCVVRFYTRQWKCWIAAENNTVTGVHSEEARRVLPHWTMDGTNTANCCNVNTWQFGYCRGISK
jgi:hypothetical protein